MHFTLIHIKGALELAIAMLVPVVIIVVCNRIATRPHATPAGPPSSPNASRRQHAPTERSAVGIPERADHHIVTHH